MWKTKLKSTSNIVLIHSKIGLRGFWELFYKTTTNVKSSGMRETTTF